eukprot:Gb_31137 [translate_table: standard]
MLGKRPRPPMNRTTSMSQLGSGCVIESCPVPECSDTNNNNLDSGSFPNSPGGVCNENIHGNPGSTSGHTAVAQMNFVRPSGIPDRSALAGISGTIWPIGSPRSNRGYFIPTIEPAHFLEACHLCNRPLGDGRDIYMYRGDSAFCSVECRQQQITMDERKEKSSASVTCIKKGQVSSSNRHENSNNGNFQAQAGTVAAA